MVKNENRRIIMKKTMIITIAMMLFVGCAGSKSTLPGFFLNPPTSADYLYGVGNAQKVNLSLARQTATARARDEIARAVSVKVSNMIKDFLQQSGVGESAQSLEFTESVSKQVANTSLSGATVKEVAQGDDGMIYVLVEYPLSSVRQSALAEVKKREAQYTEFKARQSFEDLEKEIAKLD
jgi:hypothetical protein